RWFKQVGESVAVDEPLFEVSTDKVDSEVPAPAAGVVSEILVAEGDTVEVGARLAVISDSADGAAPAATAAPVEAPPAAPEPAPAPPPAAEALAPPPAAAPAPAPEPAPVVAAPPAAEVPAPAANVSNGGGGTVTSPLVRRMLAEQGLDPATI